MTLIRWNGILLRGSDGKLARSSACCCGGVGCCGCSWLESYYNIGITDSANWRIKIALSGDGPTGNIYLCPSLVSLGDLVTCVVFRATGCDGAFDEQIPSCFGFIDMDLYCLAKNTTLTEFILSGSIDTADCNLGPITLVSATCGPPLELIFEADIIDIGGLCPCIGKVTFTVTTEHVWP